VVIEPFLIQQFLMGALLDDLAVVDHQDMIGIRMVLRRWAITKLVRPAIRRRRAFWMRASVRVSTLLVASSRIRMAGSTRMARAMASNWRWPWLRLLARSESMVSYPWGNCG